MIEVKGYAAQKAKADLAPWTFQRRSLGPNDVLVEIEYAGICHSDIHQVREEWGEALFPMVPGHEIAGRVKEVGTSVTKFKPGMKAGVGVFIDSCRKCENCLKGENQYCLEGMTGTYNGYERDGKTIAQGGYSTAIVVHEDYVLKLPDNLDMAGVAPLLCAGITLYSPLKHWGAGPGKKVGIIGLGGLGHMGVKFAVAMGAEVSVLSHSANKEQDAKAMGAHNFILTKDESVFDKYKMHFDLLINSVSAPLDLNQYLNMLKLNGSIVMVGLSGQPYPIDAFQMLSQRRRIAGSMIGGMPETQEMLDFAGKHNIVSDIEVINADYINKAYDRVVASDVKYRFVIDAKTF
ncbi:MAG: NAD(P)-dependent alcohol dehydrogenase [Candidatus Nanopelagicales bacterium]